MALTYKRRYSGIQGREVGQQERKEKEEKGTGSADGRDIFKKGTKQVTDCQGKNNTNINIKNVSITTTNHDENDGTGGISERKVDRSGTTKAQRRGSHGMRRRH
jgi:hypothetical protein